MNRFDRSILSIFMTKMLLVVMSATACANDNFAHNHDEDGDSTADVRELAAIPVAWRKDDLAQTADLNMHVRFKILAINDFHGQLGAGRRVANRPVGSAPILAAYVRNAATNARDAALIVHAGDHVGATPPNSALLQDEPSISFLNLLANKKCSARHRLNAYCNLVGTLGNHEFDEGAAEMRRLIYGGNHARGPFLQDPYLGARFPYVSANVVDAVSGERVLPPYVIKKVRGQRVAFVGAVLKETPTIVTPTGVAGLNFLDEADAINQSVAKLKARGIRAIVVLIHQGTQQASYSGPTQDPLPPLGSAIGDIVTRLDDEVDVVVSGHAHGFTNVLMPNQNGTKILVTQAFANGTAFADIDVTLDPVSKDIVEKSASIVTTWADDPNISAAADVQALVDAADARVAPLVSRVVGTASVDILRTETPAGESALGNLIADAQRAAMSTDFAFMNPGGIRADLLAGSVTWGELFTIQPFNNDLVKMTLTGAQIKTLLEQQWQGQPFARILKPSGLSYTWNAAAPVGSRIVEMHTSAGTPLDSAASYTVTVNSFLAAGGDNFSVLPLGTQRVVGPVDLDALVNYVEALQQPFSYLTEGRIARQN